MIAEGSTATDPRTGHKVILKGGKWVDMGSVRMQDTLPQPDTDSLKQLTDDLYEKQLLAQRANEFMQRNAKTATGPGLADIHLPFIGDIGSPVRAYQDIFDQKNAANRQQMESIGNQTWVNMRPAGSGQMRMPEVEGFKQAFPNVENFGPANQDIAQRLNDEARQAAVKLNFVQDYVRSGRGSVANALSAWGSPGQQQMQPQQQSPFAAPGPQQGAPPSGAGFRILSVE